MKMDKKYLIIVGWVLIIYLLNKNGLITFNIETIKQYLIANSTYAAIIFIGLWVVRLAVFVPGVTLMILGGVCFGTLKGFLLSIIGISLSETLIFVFAKLFTNTKLKEYLTNKYPDILPLIEAYNYKFLALGVICPVAPTDIVCLLSASTGMRYVKYILTVIIANIPLSAIYSHMGLGFKDSIYSVLLMILTIGIVTFYSVKTWHTLKSEPVALTEQLNND
jgi:uncharacterized membrane protein YdjX (TVP38/TMEM64 family)